jgi:hypothetical protein
MTIYRTVINIRIVIAKVNAFSTLQVRNSNALRKNTFHVIPLPTDLVRDSVRDSVRLMDSPKDSVMDSQTGLETG